MEFPLNLSKELQRIWIMNYFWEAKHIVIQFTDKYLNLYFIRYFGEIFLIVSTENITICGKSVLGRGDYLMSYLPMKASSNRN